MANYDIAMLYMMFLLVTVLMKYRKIVRRPRRRSHRRVWVRSYLRKRRAAGTMDCNLDDNEEKGCCKTLKKNLRN
jgi:hypothetical protein